LYLLYYLKLCLNIPDLISSRVCGGLPLSNNLRFIFTDDGTVALISGTPPLTNESGGGHFDYDNVENTYRDLRL